MSQSIIKNTPLTIAVSKLLLVLVISVMPCSGALRVYFIHSIKSYLIVDQLQWFASGDLHRGAREGHAVHSLTLSSP